MTLLRHDRPPAWPAMLALAVAVTGGHIAVAVFTPYELHRDEFLYLAMGQNLRLLAMDFPPFIAILSEIQRGLFGDVLWGVRLGPALAHGALVLLTGLLAWRLGGRVFAQVLAMAPVATGPLFLRAGSLFQPVVFEQLWWTVALLLLVVLADEPPGKASLRWWVLLGLTGGIGLLTKFSVLIFGAGILVALLLAGRSWLAQPGPWLAVGIALLVGSPSWIGQIRLGWPLLSQMETLQRAQLQHVSYGSFLLDQVLMHGPGGSLLAVTGAIGLLRHRGLARWKVVGWACVAAFAIIWGLRGKPYYAGPLFPTLIAAGAVVVAASLATRRRGLALAGQAAGFALAIGWGVLLFPLALPILGPEPTARLAARLGMTAAVTTNQGVVLELPQDYADMLGWERKVGRIAGVYHGLPPADRQEAVIVTSNYGQAGAIDFYGPRHGLPRARLPKGSYWFFGPGDLPGRVVIKVGDDRRALEPFCDSVELADRIDEPWVVPEERDLAIWICRASAGSLQELWPRFKGRN